ncbi:MAG: hypothetical protein Q4G58_12180, partial [bacterium]|nr:hypothetical protein [bacterium]
YIAHPTGLYLMGAFLFCLALYFCFHKLSSCDDKQIARITIALFAVMLIGQLLFIFNFNVMPITDSYMVDDQAMQFAAGKSQTFDASVSYFSKYGNNYFVTIVTSFIFIVMQKLNISDMTHALAFLNMLLLDLAVVMLWDTVRITKDKRSAAKLLLLCVLNPGYYLLLEWYYTAVYCIPIMIAILYLCIRIYNVMKTDQAIHKLILYGLLLGIATVLGFNIRPTSVIPLIAIGICALFKVLPYKEHRKNAAITIASFAVSMLLLLAGTKSLVNGYVDDDSANFPVTHWVMMGLHGNGTFLQTDEAYTAQYNTKEEKVKANVKEINKTLKEYGLSGTLNHMVKKLEVTWTDRYADFNVRLAQDKNFGRLYKYIVEGKTDAVVISFQIFQVVLYLLLLMSILRQLKEKEDGLMFALLLSFFGAIVFYLLWEAKAIYAVTFDLLLLPLAADGMEYLGRLTTNTEHQKSPYILKKLVMVSMIVTAFIGISQYHNFINKKETWHDYSVRSYTQQMVRWDDDLSEANHSLTQEFYTSKPFNEFSIAAQPSNNKNTDCSYTISLYDEKETTLYSKKVTSDDIKNNTISFQLKKSIKPKKKQRYTIRIIGSGVKDTIQWGHRMSSMSDNYEGTCSIDGVSKSYDLFITVAKVYEASYSTGIWYTAFFIVLLLFEFTLFSLLIKRTSDSN